MNNELPQTPDEQLVAQFQKGDGDAFRTLVMRYEKKVLGIAYGVVHNSDDAKDIAQNVFLKIHRSLEKFRGDAKFYTWLYRITVNVAIDFMRKKKRKMSVEYNDAVKLNADIPIAPSKKSLPRDKVLLKELYEKLQEAIQSLSEEHRTTLVLREMENLSYQEIADTLNCSIGTVMSRIYYARRKVQQQLKPYLKSADVDT